MQILQPKRPSDTVPLSFDFASDGVFGVTPPSVSVSVFSGNNTTPLVVQSISTSGTSVIPLVSGGTVGTVYKLDVTASIKAVNSQTAYVTKTGYLPVVGEPV